MADLPKPERRKPLTRRQFAELILRQEGRCGCGCNKRLQADAIIDEHLVALDFLGSNDLTNRSLWDRDCSKAKTARDLSDAAKGKRIRGETGNGPKQKILSRGFSRPSSDPAKWQSAGWPEKGTRKLQSRGFAKVKP